MFIIFGTRGIIRKSQVADIIAKSCPSCGGDLELSDLDRWFTLFFIPIFPFSKVETFYKCAGCEQTYKQSIKDLLTKSKKDSEKFQKEIERTVFIALAACMTHMAKIDGELSEEERNELNKLSKNNEFKKDIEKTIEKVSKSKNDEDVFGLLRAVRTSLTTEGTMLMLGKIVQVLLADGKIDKKEEKLLKEYMLVCGVPRDLYNTIIKNVEKDSKLKMLS